MSQDSPFDKNHPSYFSTFNKKFAYLVPKMMRAKIIITPKHGILDPQGVAIQHAMHQLGMACVTDARVGKFIELQIDGENEQLTRTKLEQLCHELLSNPVIEDYQIIWEGKVA